MPQWVHQAWPWFLTTLHVALFLGATAHIVLRKRDVRAAIGWAGFVWLVPVLGSIAYFVLGINRIQRQAVALRAGESWKNLPDLSLTPQETQLRERFETEHPNLMGLATLCGKLTGHSALPGNRVEPLIDGDEAFPAMLAAIGGAERSVALQSYIFDSDRVGEMFLEALIAARDRGIEVRALIDDVGSRYSRPNMVRRLRKAGLKVAAFLPSRAPKLIRFANLRNHRKILVIDGRTGFTGGTNIREGHWLSMNPKEPVQCLHFRLEGPVVRHLQETFAIDWTFAANESLAGETWFPEIERQGPVWARGIPDGPDEDFEKLAEAMFAALAAARRSVRIVTPYFLPHAPLIEALNSAALRGVQVEIHLPEVNNILLVQWAAAAQYWQLLEKGCRIFLTPPPFDHTKLMLVDGLWSLIGSTNWDPRSLRLNFEFNVECYDPELAARLEALVARRLETSHEVTLEEVRALPLGKQLRNGLARLLSPYL
ncbi:MAG: cardiolipin synthase [Planctomycetales bacterium]